MNRDQLSLITFLETRIVNDSGRVDLKCMNTVDLEIASKWNDEGFIGFGRIVLADHTNSGTHWVTFSDKAWEAAHAERRARGDRILADTPYQKTKDK